MGGAFLPFLLLRKGDTLKQMAILNLSTKVHGKCMLSMIHISWVLCVHGFGFTKFLDWYASECGASLLV